MADKFINDGSVRVTFSWHRPVHGRTARGLAEDWIHKGKKKCKGWNRGYRETLEIRLKTLSGRSLQMMQSEVELYIGVVPEILINRRTLLNYVAWANEQIREKDKEIMFLSKELVTKIAEKRENSHTIRKLQQEVE